MHRVQTSLIGCAALLAAACQSTPVNGERPALIVNPTGESHAELRQAVSGLLFGAEVLLADDALTETSVLIIERKKIQSMQLPPLSGRDLGRPERFQLLTNGSECVLLRESDQARYELVDTECVPEK